MPKLELRNTRLAITYDHSKLQKMKADEHPTRTHETKYTIGVVVAVGLGHWDPTYKFRIPLDYQVGDTVLYNICLTTEFTSHDGQTVALAYPSDILAVIKE